MSELGDIRSRYMFLLSFFNFEIVGCSITKNKDAEIVSKMFFKVNISLEKTHVSSIIKQKTYEAEQPKTAET